MLGFYGAIFDGNRIRVEPLTSVFNLTAPLQDQTVKTLASAIDGFLAAVGHIQHHYNTLQPASLLFTDRKRSFPYPLSFENVDGSEMQFTYSNRMQDSKLVFSGSSGTASVVIKFTQTYSADAHSVLADQGLAPNLSKCFSIPGGWFAVIMAKSSYTPLNEVSLTVEQRAKVQHKAAVVARILHAEGFVHGDIRDTNILVDRDSLQTDDIKLHFVDFDWAGRVGEAKYPIGVNTVSIYRPTGVAYDALITQAHDLDMVENLFRSARPPLLTGPVA